MAIHTIRFDYETKKFIRELVNEIKNMNQARSKPSGNRYTPPPYKKR